MIVTEELLTRWGRELSEEMPLSEYPRPQMKRESFICLNGMWDYGIYPENASFGGYQGKILVPFSPECILSGVKRTVTPEDKLYYRKSFSFSPSSDRVLLHFTAVDYECEVSLNGKEVCRHKGGYFPFSADVTDLIKEGENELTLTVRDPSETGSGASGKQTFRRGGIWYSPQSGIWGTVWLEEVPESYIESIRLTPDIDNGTVSVSVSVKGESSAFSAEIYDGGRKICSAGTTESSAVMKLSEFECWSPENPKLYDIVIKSGRDRVESYFGMRKFSRGKDSSGRERFMLNNKPYFMTGLLDQGYWSDGMYTAPSDEALIYDIESAKKMGFNVLRKHIKLENPRWYYHCDRLGMLVWQDMINGGGRVKPLTAMVSPALSLATGTKAGHLSDGRKNYALFSREDREGREEYYVDSARLIDTLYNCVSLCMWVPFNEGWGQFDAAKAEKFYREKDSTRLIDHASGWHDRGKGDVNSFHIYFTPFYFPKFSEKDNRVIALTEFGGYSLRIPGHIFNKNKNFGYRIYKTRPELENAIYGLYIKKLLPLRDKKGLSALIYTELSDVEDETNGLMTYDREVLKIDSKLMRDINGRFRF